MNKIFSILQERDLRRVINSGQRMHYTLSLFLFFVVLNLNCSAMKTQNEIWKAIPGYEGLYEVSNLGRVKSLDRWRKNGQDTGYLQKGKVMKLTKDKRGYYHINLWKKNIRKLFRVHQLVAMAFLNHIPKGFKIEVDHINNDKSDNRIDNLQLISHRENSTKDLRKGTSKYVGVSWHSQKGKWRANIRIKGRLKEIGHFTNELDAAQAYQNALKEIQEG